MKSIMDIVWDRIAYKVRIREIRKQARSMKTREEMIADVNRLISTGRK